MTVSTVKKSHATIPAAWARRNVVHDSDARPGAGSIPACLEDRPHRRRGDGDAEPGEFTVDAAVAPGRVLPSETDDHPAGLDGGGWPAGPVRVGPVVRDEASMPTPGSCRASPGRSTSGHGRATRANAVRIARSSGSKRGRGDLALQDRELVAQHEDLDILGTIRAAAQHQQVDHEPDKTVETGHAPILAALDHADQRTRNPRSTHPDEFPAPTGPARSAPRSLADEYDLVGRVEIEIESYGARIRCATGHSAARSSFHSPAAIA